MPSRTLLAAYGLLAALPLLLLLAPAHARAADTVKMQFAVEVTGIHVVDWVHDPGTTDTCKAWSKGSGTQTTGFSTKRPVRYTGMKIVGKLPEIMRNAPRFTLLGFGRTSDFKATVERKGDWEEHLIPNQRPCVPCGPLSEYGECGDAPLPPAPLFSCGRRDIKAAGANLAFVAKGSDDDGPVALTDALRVDLAASSDGLFPHCPPELADGTGRELQQPDPREVSFVGAKVRKLQSLRVGQKITLKDSSEAGYVSESEKAPRELDACSSATLSGPGYRECAITDVTVEVRRTR